MSTSQITSLRTVYSTVCSGTDQRKHQSSASLAFVRGIHRWPVNSPHKGPVTRTMFPFDDVIMVQTAPFKSSDKASQDLINHETATYHQHIVVLQTLWMHMSLFLLYCNTKWHTNASFRLKYVSGAHLVGHMLNWIVHDRIILNVGMVCSNAYPRIHYLKTSLLCISISPKYKSYSSILLTIHVLLCVVAVWYLQINFIGDKEVVNIAPKPVKWSWRIWIN